MYSNGFVSAVQITVKHDTDAAFELKASGMIAEHVTNNDSTTFIVVVPEDGVLFEIDSQGGFSVEEVLVANSAGLITSNIVNQFALMSAYPNPFNPETVISFDLYADSNVDLSIYNMVGQKVATLVNEFKENGSYQVNWGGVDNAGTALASGIYLVKLTTSNGVLSSKVTLLK